MLEIEKSKKKKCDSLNKMHYIKREQKVNSFTKSIKINEKKSGEQRVKPRLASDITMIQLKNPVKETQKMTVSKFKRRAQIPYSIEEILTLLQSSFNKEEELDRVFLHTFIIITSFSCTMFIFIISVPTLTLIRTCAYIVEINFHAIER